MTLYFDYCATTPLDDRVVSLITEVNEHVFGNPSSIHQPGQEARGYMEIARRQLAKAIHCEPEEIFFTGSGSEANNIALWNVIHGEKKHIILSPIEHPSISTTVEKLEKFGVSFTIVDVDKRGVVNPGDISQAIRKDETGLVTIMTANNETGTIEPVEEIAQLCTEGDIPFHTDAVQALGKIPVDVTRLNVTSMSFSAHKLYGPKGVGALYVKKGTNPSPLIIGGGQEQRLRGGTENVPGIAGFGLAVEIAVEKLEQEAIRLESLRELFLKKLLIEFPKIFINGFPDNHLPGVVNLTVPGTPGDTLLINLDLDGIAISTGAACSSGTTRPSRILKAMGISDEFNIQSLRISFGRFTREKDVDTLVQSMTTHIHKLNEVL